MDQPVGKSLKEDSLYFWTDIHERLPKTVPAPTPTGIENFLLLPFPIPETFPSLDDFDIPYVRDAGIKTTIDILGQYLGCTNYAFDYIQFWLLDVLTDCLWRTQDDYDFTKPEQKLVLEWILYMFRIMRDPTIIFSRKQFFKMFKEAILMAGQLVQEGHDVIPKPDELFLFVLKKDPDEKEEEGEEGESEEESSSSDSTSIDISESESTFTISENTSEHIILMDIGGKERKYVLKRKTCSCEQGSTPSFGTTFTSDMTRTVDSVENIEEEIIFEEEEQLDAEEESSESYIEPFQNKDYKMFHNPDTKTPARFIPLPKVEKQVELFLGDPKKYAEEKTDLPCQIIGDVLLLKDEFSTTTTSISSWGEPHKPKEKPDQSDVQMIYSEKNKTRQQEMKDELRENNLEGKSQDPDSSRERAPTRARNTLKEHTERMLKQMLADMDVQDAVQETCGLGIEYKTKNLSILCAIIDLVFDYFYQNFHFTLLKLALKTNPSFLIQEVNKEWSVPKTMLAELVKPKSKPKKKEKPKKKDKKKDKKSKGKDKKSKGKGKKKDKSDKKSKKSKKSEKVKPKKLTKEELKKLKAEQEKQKLLEQQMEEERRKLEENRRCLFPLADAGDDNLFMGLFENWEKPKDTKEKGGKKGKKGKGKGKGKK